MKNNSIQSSSLNSKSSSNGNNIDVPTIRILIVDNQDLICQQLKQVLEPEIGLEVVGTATNGATAINLIESLNPDIVLVDLELPLIDGFETIEIIVKRFICCKIIVLSSSDSKEDINRALKAGARGYLLKSTPPEEMANAIRSAGKSYFQLSPGLFTKIFLPKLNSESAEKSQESESLATKFAKDKTNNTSDLEKKLFRQESLERLSSPERLDQLMQVINPKSWIPLSTLGVIGFTALTWSIFGSIPVTVQGKGVLVYPSTVVPVQSKNSGQIIDLKVENGDVIKKGDIIATIDQSDRNKQLQLAQAKLAQLQSQNLEAKSIQTLRQQEDAQAMKEQRQSLEQKLQIVQDLTPSVKEKGLVAIQQQRESLEKRRQTLQELFPTFEERLKKRELLFTKGALSEDSVLQARQEFFDNTASLDEVESQLKELDVQEADKLQQHLSNLNEIKNIQAQLQEIKSKQAGLNQQDLERLTGRQKEMQEAEREIAQIQQQINTESQIVSQYSGHILETTVNPGEVIQAGSPIVSINTESKSAKLTSVTYFPVQEGKKVKSGMDIQITPQTVKRERFGGIVGEINRVSAFPISIESASRVVGNSQIIKELVPENQPVVIQVAASLQSDQTTFSKYKWSSSAGPQLKISAGTTTSVRVKVEERAPITFVFPILRSISGIY